MKLVSKAWLVLGATALGACLETEYKNGELNAKQRSEQREDRSIVTAIPEPDKENNTAVGRPTPANEPAP